jgi:hypothetical protein
MNTVVKGGHLHFEVRHRAENVGKGLDGRIDPLPFLVNYTIPKCLFLGTELTYVPTFRIFNQLYCPDPVVGCLQSA